MRWIGFGLALLAVALAVGYQAQAQGGPACQFGRVQGFVSVRNDPEYLVGTIPSGLTGSLRYIQRRYNCTKRGVQIRRVELGIYDVRFPGLHRRSSVVTAVSQEGVAASAQPIDIDTYRVALRGPLVRDNVLGRRDVAFTIAVF